MKSRPAIKTTNCPGEKVNRMYITLKPDVELTITFDKIEKMFNIFIEVGASTVTEILAMQNEWAVQKIVQALILEWTGSERRMVIVGVLNR